MIRDFLMDDSNDMDISAAKDIDLSDEVRAKPAEVFADVELDETIRAT